MISNIVWEVNYKPILRAAETDVKPHAFVDGFSLDAMMQPIYNKVNANAKVFRLEDADGVLKGVAIVDWTTGTAVITHMRLRNPKAGDVAQATTQVQTLVTRYAPL
jgi:hypothetical protein